MEEGSTRRDKSESATIGPAQGRADPDVVPAGLDLMVDATLLPIRACTRCLRRRRATLRAGCRGTRLRPRCVRSPPFEDALCSQASFCEQAWGRRQRINPRRAMTKRVKLTQGAFIASRSTSPADHILAAQVTSSPSLLSQPPSRTPTSQLESVSCFLLSIPSCEAALTTFPRRHQSEDRPSSLT